MKITVDTNVLISATFWYGDSHKIIEYVEQKTVDLILSKEILQEYAEVLDYDEFQNKIKDKKLDMKYTVHKFAVLAKIVEPLFKIHIIDEDPDDNKILECALEGGVNYIISQDNHLLKLNQFQGIKIITPSQFLESYLPIHNKTDNKRNNIE